MSEPQRFPTRDELDYAARKEAGFPGLGVPARQSQGVISELQTSFAVEDNDTSAYVGVTQDRMTYANETEQPLKADEGVEADREERLLKQEVLVAPAPAQPDANQTGGGGSLQEPVYTALSGEGYSAEIAKPVETEKVSAEESPTGVEGEVAKPGGSTGQTVSEGENERLGEQAGSQAPADEPVVAGANQGEPEESSSSTTRTPRTPRRS